MSRIARTSPVSANMYRHFAIITVVITACLALFVDGENRDAMAEQVVKAANKTSVDEEQSSPKGTRNRIAYRRSNQNVRGWGPDPVVVQDDTTSYITYSQTQPHNGPSANLSGSGPPLPSMVAGAKQGLAVAGLGVPESADPAKLRKKANPVLAKPTRQELEDILRASSERSGASGEDLDL